MEHHHNILKGWIEICSVLNL